MRLLIYTDVHWSKTSSIIREKGKRLANVKDSVNWAENYARIANCDAIVCLGDFFDSPSLDAEEMTYLVNTKWDRTLPHYFLVGNHEMADASREFFSTQILNMYDFMTVISETCCIKSGDTDIIFLPYMCSDDIKPFKEYIEETGCHSKKRIVLSHNDLQAQYGFYKSNIGFTIDEIEQNCDLFVNGHLHNGSKVSDKVINLGNLTGQNFNEDAYFYSHNVMVLDTDTLEYSLVENPYAFNFYKIKISSLDDFNSHIEHMATNAVISLTVPEKDADEVRKRLEEMLNKIGAYRLTIEAEASDANIVESAEELQVDHLNSFVEYVKKTIGMSDNIITELSEVCKV